MKVLGMRDTPKWVKANPLTIKDDREISRVILKGKINKFSKD